MTILNLMFIGLLQITSYQSVPEQTDSSPFHTSIGEHVHKHGVAASRDLLCPATFFKKTKIRLHKRNAGCPSGRLHYGDWVYVQGFGPKQVNDTMNARHKRSIDLWVGSHAEEKRIQVRKGEVWLMAPAPTSTPYKKIKEGTIL
jgi:hypothetical protein